jgi:hypothetical protein
MRLAAINIVSIIEKKRKAPKSGRQGVKNPIPCACKPVTVTKKDKAYRPIAEELDM